MTIFAVRPCPDGEHHYQLILEQLLPVGQAHPFFGGVLIDGVLFGRTGFGTRLQPTARTLAAFWGRGRLYVDNVLAANDRVVHLMTTDRLRSPDYDGYRLLWDHELGRAHGVQTHLLLPDMVVTPRGGMQKRPLPSGFIMANGHQQPFIHLMFETTLISDPVGVR